MKYNPAKNPNIIEFSNKPTIDKKDWIEAYKYNQRKIIASNKMADSTYAFIYAGKDNGRSKLSQEIG